MFFRPFCCQPSTFLRVPLFNRHWKSILLVLGKTLADETRVFRCRLKITLKFRSSSSHLETANCEGTCSALLQGGVLKK